MARKRLCVCPTHNLMYILLIILLTTQTVLWLSSTLLRQSSRYTRRPNYVPLWFNMVRSMASLSIVTPVFPLLNREHTGASQQPLRQTTKLSSSSWRWKVLDAPQTLPPVLAYSPITFRLAQNVTKPSVYSVLDNPLGSSWDSYWAEFLHRVE